MRRIPYAFRLFVLSALLAALTMGPTQATALSAFSLSVYLGYFALVATLSGVSLALPWSLVARAATVFVVATGVMIFGTVVELSFFSVPGTVNLMQLIGTGTVAALAGAFVVTWVFPPMTQSLSAVNDLRQYVKARRVSHWIGLFLAAVSVYVFFYLTIGAIAYQYTELFYSSGELGLVVPELQTVVWVQFLRGSLYVFSIWLLIAGSHCHRLKTAALCGLALFVLGGLTPLLLNNDWPLPLRVYHGVEIFFQNGLAGFVICLILGNKSQMHADNETASVSQSEV